MLRTKLTFLDSSAAIDDQHAQTKSKEGRNLWWKLLGSVGAALFSDILRCNTVGSLLRIKLSRGA